jgi:hypothetical protein
VTIRDRRAWVLLGYRLCYHRDDSRDLIGVGMQGRAGSPGSFPVKILSEKLLERATSGYMPTHPRDWKNPE